MMFLLQFKPIPQSTVDPSSDFGRLTQEQLILRSVLELVESTMTWMMLEKTLIIIHSLKCWEIGHLGIISRQVYSHSYKIEVF